MKSTDKQKVKKRDKKILLQVLFMLVQHLTIP